MKSHCQEVAGGNKGKKPSAPKGKAKATAAKPPARQPKEKVKSQPKAAAGKSKAAKAKAAKAKAASKSKGRKPEDDEEALQETEEVPEAEGLKRPAAFRRPSASPKQKSSRVSPEEDAKATEGKISNPYFYSNLNQWGIKVNGKQKVSVRCSDHWQE